MKIKRLKGFTLIELMIVVAIVGILAAIALPAYQEYAKQARRADAKSAILAAQLAQEKWRANNAAYTNDMTDLGYAGASAQPSPDSYYSVTISGASATAYLITATPAGIQVGDDCGTYALDQNGENHTGTYASATCWDK